MSIHHFRSFFFFEKQWQQKQSTVISEEKDSRYGIRQVSFFSLNSFMFKTPNSSNVNNIPFVKLTEGKMVKAREPTAMNIKELIVKMELLKPKIGWFLLIKGLFKWDRDNLRPAWVRTCLRTFLFLCLHKTRLKLNSEASSDIAWLRLRLPVCFWFSDTFITHTIIISFQNQAPRIFPPVSC